MGEISRDFLELKEKLEKSLSQEDYEVSADIVGQMKGLEVTIDFLQSSQAGIFLRKVKKEHDGHAALVAAVDETTRAWKERVKAEQKSADGGGASAATKKKKDDEEAKAEAAARRRRALAAEPTAVPEKPLAMRNTMGTLLAKTLGGGGVDPELIKFAGIRGSQIEDRLFEHFATTSEAYKAQFRVVNGALSNNRELKEAILEGSYDMKFLSTASSDDIASKEVLERKRKLQKFILEESTIQKPVANTNMYTCGKCKSNKCSYYQMQTRSADEPMTTFVTCTSCTNRWKIG